MKPTLPKDQPGPEAKPIWKNPFPQGSKEAREESLRVVREAKKAMEEKSCSKSA